MSINRSGVFTWLRSRRRSSLATLAVAGVAAVVPVLSRAAPAASPAPAALVSAVRARLDLLAPTYPALTDRATFEDLQQAIERVATTWYVDPDTGERWTRETLLMRASSKPDWLAPSVSVAARTGEVRHVVDLLAWRLGYRASGLSTFVGRHAEANGVADGCSSDASGRFEASPELLDRWRALFPAALGGQGSPSVAPTTVGTIAHYRSSTGRAEVDVERVVVVARGEDPPLRGAPVDEARVVLDDLAPGGGPTKLEAFVDPAPTAALPAASEFAAPGVDLRAAEPDEVQLPDAANPQGLYRASFVVPPNFVLDATSLYPAVRIRVQGEEPPPGFASSPDVVGQTDQNGTGCDWSRTWTGVPDHLALIYHEQLPAWSAVGRIQGKVLDARSTGLAGVALQLVGHGVREATTDATGQFRFDDLPPGSYEIAPVRGGPDRLGHGAGVRLRGRFVSDRCAGYSEPSAHADRCVISFLRGGRTADADFVYVWPDLRAEALEVTQGVQRRQWFAREQVAVPGFDQPVAGGRYVGVPLVERLPTIVRLYASVKTARDAREVQNVGAELRGYERVGGRLEELPGSPLRPLDAVADTLGVGPTLPDARLFSRDGYSFELPAAWTTVASLTLVGEVNPAPGPSGDRPISECCEENDAFALADISFHDVSPITIVPVTVVYRFPGETEDVVRPSLATWWQRVLEVLPLPPNRLTFESGSRVVNLTSEVRELRTTYHLTRPDLSDCATVAACDDTLYADVLAKLGDFGASPRARRFVVASIGSRLRSATFIPAGESIITAPTVPRPLTSLAHEFLHLLGFQHASAACGGGSGGQIGERWPPDEQGEIQGFGLDRASATAAALGRFALMGPSWFDLMSYCAVGPGGDADAWISTRNWARFVTGTIPPRETTPAYEAPGGPTAPRLVVDAVALPGGAVRLASVERTTGPAPRARAIGPFTIRVRDARGHVVSSTTVAAASVADAPDVRMVRAVVAAPPRAASVEVDRGAQVLARRRRPPLPAVRLVAPRTRARVRASRPLVVRWRTRGCAVNACTARVDVSADGGRSWKTVVVGAPGSAVALAPATLRPTRVARVRVSVNDGFDDVVAVSKPFRVRR